MDYTLDHEWIFVNQDLNSATQPDFNDAQFEQITLPHTWNATDAQQGNGKMIAFALPKFAGYSRKIAWYRHWEYIPPEYSGQRLFLRFEAISSLAEIYLNTQHVCTHKGAFGAFCCEITDYVKFGQKNLLSIKVSNLANKNIAPLSGDFPLFGGIYRPIHLIITNPVCISPIDYASSGIYIKQSKVSEKEAILDISVQISTKKKNSPNPTQSSSKFTIDYLISDDQQKPVFHEIQHLDLELSENIDTEIVQKKIIITNPHLWNGISDPYLYSMDITLLENNQTIDVKRVPIGLRFFHVDSKQGFFLNGKPYFIHGVCKHQDRINKGWAVSHDDLKEDAEILHELGARGVRCAHYQHAEDFYSFCDKHGILVWAEIPLVNKVNNNAEFIENASQQLIEMIRQNYNHPSIFCWGMCNEVGLFQLSEPATVISQLHTLAKQEDPTRYTVLAAILQAKFRKKLNNSTDLLALNAYPGWYYGKPTDMNNYLDEFNVVGNSRGLGVSEYGAGAGISQHEQNPQKPKAAGKWHPEEYQCILHEEIYRIIQSKAFIWGSFLWNAFDFAVPFRKEGDTEGRNDKGLVTYDRKVKKDAFYFYKANWTQQPMVYITSRRHTTRTEAKTPVKVYSNCESVELFVNRESKGMMEKHDLGIFKLENIELKSGENYIEVKANFKDQTICDKCTWNLL